MDTRFWGPPGWRLLHLLTFQYNPTTQKSAMRRFLETLPYILPCKYCRASLTDYYRELPITNAVLESQDSLSKWLYAIHNKVNDKLRSQGLTTTPNPTYASVERYYKTWIDDGGLPIHAGWDFLFAIAYNHPKEASRHTSPMPECPPRAKTCKSIRIRNKWNTLPFRPRLHWYKRFWETLPAVLSRPDAEAWKAACAEVGCTLTNRKSTLAWLWRLRCVLDAGFQDPYQVVCQRIAAFSSGCGKARKGVTCRKKRT